MDALREAVTALAHEVGKIEAAVSAGEDVPSQDQLAALQRGVARIQQCLNRLQTTMDAWSEEREAV